MLFNIQKYFLIGIFILPIFIHAQNNLKAENATDSTLLMKVDEANRVDVILQRAWLAFGKDEAAAPLRSSTGSWTLALGFRLPLGDKMGLHIQPGFKWLKLNYDMKDTARSFPDGDTHDSQRHRLTYFEAPLGFYYNLKLDENKKPLLFVEVGGYAGILTNRLLKQGDVETVVSGVDAQGNPTTTNQLVKSKRNNIIGAEPLNYGVYARIGGKPKKFMPIALYWSMRLSDIFVEKIIDPVTGENTDTNYPKFKTMQLGVTFSL